MDHSNKVDKTQKQLQMMLDAVKNFGTAAAGGILDLDDDLDEMFGKDQ